ncbi:hypothetical protein [Clostridium sp. SGI.024]
MIVTLKNVRFLKYRHNKILLATENTGIRADSTVELSNSWAIS